MMTLVYSISSIIFRAGLGNCLNDEPQESMYKFTGALAGTVYDADEQCNLLYPNSKLCSQVPDNFCEDLMCQKTKYSCVGNSQPPADGTKCGENKVTIYYIRTPAGAKFLL